MLKESQMDCQALKGRQGAEPPFPGPLPSRKQAIAACLVLGPGPVWSPCSVRGHSSGTPLFPQLCTKRWRRSPACCRREDPQEILAIFLCLGMGRGVWVAWGGGRKPCAAPLPLP